MKVCVKNSDGTANTTSISTEDGTPLRYVSAIDIHMQADSIITANLTFIVPLIDCVAYATVSEDHLRELAAAHGFELVKAE